MKIDRVLLIVCDSLGVGGAPDAAAYGDEESNTAANTARAVGGLRVPNLAALGLGAAAGPIEGVPAFAAAAGTAHGSMSEASAGKDSTTGHWEIAQVITDRPFPTYPNGFPQEVIEPFVRAIGRDILGNKPASGTQIIDELGEEHLRTRKPIVYTSGDSVFQIACHRRVAGDQTLYEWCRAARRLLTDEHAVGRVIARPFDGEPGAFVRTAGRRDFSLPPPRPTMLDRLAEARVGVYGVGKIRDVFCGQGVTEGHYSASNDDGVELALAYLARPAKSLVFANLVDFDSKYGHRNDAAGYARCLEEFDARLPQILDEVARARGVLFITGDHGCDPTTPPTDHSRERVPVLAGGLGTTRPAVDLGVRSTFADLGATIADILTGATQPAPDAVGAPVAGTSFAEDLGL
jgi:phosphopentomutase